MTIPRVEIVSALLISLPSALSWGCYNRRRTRRGLFITASLCVTWPCHQICIRITIEAMFAITIWFFGILLRDQDHCDGSHSAFTVLETTRTCDLVQNDEDGDDNMMDTILLS